MPRAKKRGCARAQRVLRCTRRGRGATPSSVASPLNLSHGEAFLGQIDDEQHTICLDFYGTLWQAILDGRGRHFYSFLIPVAGNIVHTLLSIKKKDIQRTQQACHGLMLGIFLQLTVFSKKNPHVKITIF
ncbi:hypothetical protein D1007_53297 [Hordeum vulgare]|nr:hypothetical protein D1007_53297 [Hordeum vulgare]